jgi:hypothetical protein
VFAVAAGASLIDPDAAAFINGAAADILDTETTINVDSLKGGFTVHHCFINTNILHQFEALIYWVSNFDRLTYLLDILDTETTVENFLGKALPWNW